MHEDIIKMCLHMFGESLPELDGLLLTSPPCLVFTPSFCKAAWGTPAQGIHVALNLSP